MPTLNIIVFFVDNQINLASNYAETYQLTIVSPEFWSSIKLVGK